MTSPPGTYLPPGETAPITDPAGTFSGAGATAPTIDLGGTYSGAGASAATEDPAGTYTSPYALTRMFVVWQQNTPATTYISFHNETEVDNYYGLDSGAATLASEFFDNGAYNNIATMDFTRIGLGQRPHLLGANIYPLSLSQLQEISGSVSLTFDGYTYSGDVNLSNVATHDNDGYRTVAKDVQAALNSNRPTLATTTGDTLTPETAQFMGYTVKSQLYVTSVQSGSVTVGGTVTAAGYGPTNPIIHEISGAPGGVGHYSFFDERTRSIGSAEDPVAFTETYGMLTVGQTSAPISTDTQLSGHGLSADAAIITQLSAGNGDGSQWIVTEAPDQVEQGDFSVKAPLMSVTLNGGRPIIDGATQDNAFLNVSANGYFGFDEVETALSFATGSAADKLGLGQGDGGYDSSPGGVHETVPQYINGILHNETDQWASIEVNTPRYVPAFEHWQENSGFAYQFISTQTSTTPAGSDQPVTDPSGTHSGAGASKPIRNKSDSVLSELMAQPDAASLESYSGAGVGHDSTLSELMAEPGASSQESYSGAGVGHESPLSELMAQPGAAFRESYCGAGVSHYALASA
jgi:Protein of unknown function (DUF3383)